MADYNINTPVSLSEANRDANIDMPEPEPSSESRPLTESRSCDALQQPPGLAMQQATANFSLGGARSGLLPRRSPFGRTFIAPFTMSQRINAIPAIRTSCKVDAQSFQFLQLPGEIRMLIYKHRLAHLPPYLDVFNNRSIAMHAVRHRKGILKLLPTLGYVNRQVYMEIVSLILSEWRIEMQFEEDVVYFDEVLQYLPLCMGYQTVKKIACTRFSEFASSPARALFFLDFLKRVPNLEEVHLTVRLDHLHMPDADPASRQIAFINRAPGVKTAEQIAANYSLATLCELNKLLRVIVHCEWSEPIQPTPTTLSAFFDVKLWLARELQDTDGVKHISVSHPFSDPKGMAAWMIRILR